MSTKKTISENSSHNQFKTQHADPLTDKNIHLAANSNSQPHEESIFGKIANLANAAVAYFEHPANVKPTVPVKVIKGNGEDLTHHPKLHNEVVNHEHHNEHKEVTAHEQHVKVLPVYEQDAGDPNVDTAVAMYPLGLVYNGFVTNALPNQYIIFEEELPNIPFSTESQQPESLFFFGPPPHISPKLPATTIEKLVDGEHVASIPVGSEADYTISVTTHKAEFVTVEDVLPVGLGIPSLPVLNLPSTVSFDSATNTITWKFIASPETHTETLHFDAQVVAVDAGSTSNPGSSAAVESEWVSPSNGLSLYGFQFTDGLATVANKGVPFENSEGNLEPTFPHMVNEAPIDFDSRGPDDFGVGVLSSTQSGPSESDEIEYIPTNSFGQRQEGVVIQFNEPIVGATITLASLDNAQASDGGEFAKITAFNQAGDSLEVYVVGPTATPPASVIAFLAGQSFTYIHTTNYSFGTENPTFELPMLPAGTQYLGFSSLPTANGGNTIDGYDIANIQYIPVIENTATLTQGGSNSSTATVIPETTDYDATTITHSSIIQGSTALFNVTYNDGSSNFVLAPGQVSTITITVTGENSHYEFSPLELIGSPAGVTLTPDGSIPNTYILTFDNTDSEHPLTVTSANLGLSTTNNLSIGDASDPITLSLSNATIDTNPEGETQGVPVGIDPGSITTTETIVDNNPTSYDIIDTHPTGTGGYDNSSTNYPTSAPITEQGHTATFNVTYNDTTNGFTLDPGSYSSVIITIHNSNPAYDLGMLQPHMPATDVTLTELTSTTYKLTFDDANGSLTATSADLFLPTYNNNSIGDGPDTVTLTLSGAEINGSSTNAGIDPASVSTAIQLVDNNPTSYDIIDTCPTGTGGYDNSSPHYPTSAPIVEQGHAATFNVTYNDAMNGFTLDPGTTSSVDITITGENPNFIFSKLDLAPGQSGDITLTGSGTHYVLTFTNPLGGGLTALSADLILQSTNNLSIGDGSDTVKLTLSNPTVNESSTNGVIDWDSTSTAVTFEDVNKTNFDITGPSGYDNSSTNTSIPVIVEGETAKLNITYNDATNGVTLDPGQSCSVAITLSGATDLVKSLTLANGTDSDDSGHITLTGSGDNYVMTFTDPSSGPPVDISEGLILTTNGQVNEHDGAETIFATLSMAKVNGVSEGGGLSGIDPGSQYTAISVEPKTDLSIEKLVDGQHSEIVTPGQTITFEITVDNQGPSDAHNVIVNDVLPAGLMYESSSPLNAYNTGTHDWTIGTLAAGASDTLDITAKVEIPNNTTVLNFENNPDTSNVFAYQAGSAFETGNMLNLGDANGQVSLTSNGDGVVTVQSGDFVNYVSPALPEINYNPVGENTEALVVNLGTSAVEATVTASEFFPTENGTGEYGELTAFSASGAEVGKIFFGPEQGVLQPGFVLSDGAVFVPASYTDGSNGTFAVNDQMFGNHEFQYLAFSSLPYGAGVINTPPPPNPSEPGLDSSDYYVQQISYISDGSLNPITNTATVTTTTINTNPNNMSSATVTPEEADISILKTVSSALAPPNSDVTFTIEATNFGPNNAIVTVEDKLPTGITFVSDSAGVSYDPNSGIWNIGSLNNGATDTLTIVGLLTQANTTYTNTASVLTSNLYDPYTGNNSSSVSVTTTAYPTLTLTKVATDVTPVVGHEVTFIETIGNAGPGFATDVQVSDPLPAGLTFESFKDMSGPDSLTYNNGVVTVNGVMAANTQDTFSITALVTDDGEPVALWSGNNNPNDSLGMNNGVYAGGYEPGQFNDAFKITTAGGGVDDPVPAAPTSNVLDPQLVSVAAWVEAVAPGQFEYIVDKGSSGLSGAGSYALYTGASGGVQFYVSNGGTGSGSIVLSPADAPANIWDGNWHLVVGTYNGSQADLYVDGNLIGSTSGTVSGGINYNLNESNDFYIGQFANTNTLNFIGSNGTGGIDEVQVYNSALTAGEVQTLYNNTSITETVGTLTTNGETTSQWANVGLFAFNFGEFDHGQVVPSGPLSLAGGNDNFEPVINDRGSGDTGMGVGSTSGGFGGPPIGTNGTESTEITLNTATNQTQALVVDLEHSEVTSAIVTLSSLGGGETGLITVYSESGADLGSVSFGMAPPALTSGGDLQTVLISGFGDFRYLAFTATDDKSETQQGANSSFLVQQIQYSVAGGVITNTATATSSDAANSGITASANIYPEETLSITKALVPGIFSYGANGDTVHYTIAVANSSQTDSAAVTLTDMPSPGLTITSPAFPDIVSVAPNSVTDINVTATIANDITHPVTTLTYGSGGANNESVLGYFAGTAFTDATGNLLPGNGSSSITDFSQANGIGVLTGPTNPDQQDYENTSPAISEIHYNGITNQTQADLFSLGASPAATVDAVAATIVLKNMFPNENSDGEYMAVTAFGGPNGTTDEGTVIIGVNNPNIPTYEVNPDMLSYANGKLAIVVNTVDDPTDTSGGTQAVTLTSQMFGGQAFDNLVVTGVQYAAGINAASSVVWPFTPGLYNSSDTTHNPNIDSSDAFVYSIAYNSGVGQAINITNTATATEGSVTVSATAPSINQIANLAVVTEINNQPISNVNDQNSAAAGVPNGNLSHDNTFPLTFTLTDDGPSNASNVAVAINLPAGLTIVGTSASAGTYSNGVWFIPSIANGGSDVLTITAKDSTTTTQGVTASIIQSDQFETYTGNNVSNANFTVASSGHQTGDVTLTNMATIFTGTGAFTLGANGTSTTGTWALQAFPAQTNNVVVYQNVITNYGPGNAASVAVANTLPASLAAIDWAEVELTSAGVATLVNHGNGAIPTNESVSLVSGESVIFYTAATINHSAPAIITDSASIKTTDSVFTNTNHPSSGMASSSDTAGITTVAATVNIDPKTEGNSADVTHHGHTSHVLLTSHVLDTAFHALSAKHLVENHQVSAADEKTSHTPHVHETISAETLLAKCLAESHHESKGNSHLSFNTASNLGTLSDTINQMIHHIQHHHHH